MPRAGDEADYTLAPREEGYRGLPPDYAPVPLWLMQQRAALGQCIWTGQKHSRSAAPLPWEAELERRQAEAKREADAKREAKRRYNRERMRRLRAEAAQAAALARQLSEHAKAAEVSKAAAERMRQQGYGSPAE